MGVGLYLCATTDDEVDDPAEWFGQVWNWVCEEYPPLALYALMGQTHEGFPQIRMKLHPAASPLEIWFEDKRRVMFMANTHMSGPGYHLFLCYLLSELSAKVGIVWDAIDDVDLRDQQNPAFFSGNNDQAYSEMLRWMHGNALNTAGVMQQGYSNVQWSMDMDHFFGHEGVLATCMGPRDRIWLESVIADPNNGHDIFPWCQPEIGADLWLSTAVYLMWVEVRWRTPINADEESLLNTVLSLLEHSYSMNPELSYPWIEWAEILGYLGRECEYVKAALTGQTASAVLGANLMPERKIGYRRSDVKLHTDYGWWLQLPGSCSEHLDTESRVYTFGDLDREIKFIVCSPRFKSDNEPFTTAEVLASISEVLEELGEPVHESDTDGILKRTYVTAPQNADDSWVHTCLLIFPGLLATCQIFSAEMDIPFASSFFAAIAHSGFTPTPDYVPSSDREPVHCDLRCRSGTRTLAVQCVDEDASAMQD